MGRARPAAVTAFGLARRSRVTVVQPGGLEGRAGDLLALALDGGAPDNITCIVADVDG